MSTTLEAPAQAPEKANGLATYLKVSYSPAEAFDALARVPTWGWAALIGSILAIVGGLLVVPSSMHLSHIVQEQTFSQMPADQAAAARAITAKIPQWIYPLSTIVFTPIVTFFIWLVVALVFLGGAALSGGEARFRGAWTATLNAGIIPALGAVVAGVILWLRGPDSANTAKDLYALPSPDMFLNVASVKLAAFLFYSLKIASLWWYVVAVLALEHVLKMSRTAAIVTVAIIALVQGGLLALLAK